MHSCVYVCVCIDLYMYACICGVWGACMHVCMLCICMRVLMFACVYICVCVTGACLCVNVYFVGIGTCECIYASFVYIYMQMHCVSLCLGVCICVYWCVRVCISGACVGLGYVYA